MNNSIMAGPAIGSRAVTPSDADNLEVEAGALYVTVGGDVKFVGRDGRTDTWTVADKSFLPIRIRQVLATGTTATGIHALIF